MPDATHEHIARAFDLRARVRPPSPEGVAGLSSAHDRSRARPGVCTRRDRPAAHRSRRTGQRLGRRAVTAARLDPRPRPGPPRPQRGRPGERPRRAPHVRRPPRPATPTSSGTPAAPARRHSSPTCASSAARFQEPGARARGLVAHGGAAQRRHRLGRPGAVPALGRGRAAPCGPRHRLRAGGSARRSSPSGRSTSSPSVSPGTPASPPLAGGRHAPWRTAVARRAGPARAGAPRLHRHRPPRRPARAGCTGRPLTAFRA